MNYYLITLGCPKNSVDSEGMERLLTDQGHCAVSHPHDADVLIVNTCSFIADARDETIEVLEQLSAQKRVGQRLIAAGCMAESHPDLINLIDGVDATLSTRQWMHIGDVLSSTELSGAEESPDWRTFSVQRLNRSASAYIKIADGCNLSCAFCAIPSFKGAMRSKPPSVIVTEARQLVEQGAVELILIAQHLTDYGRDLDLDDGLAVVLDELCAAVPPSIWIRLMYAYPHGMTPRLVESMARHPQVCHYLDMPLQHAHPGVLRRMGRPADMARVRQTIDMLRAAMPDIALRSTFLVGFPGETASAFRQLLSFLQDIHFDRVGAFRYSAERNTRAATLPARLADAVINRRWHHLMRTQQPISLACNRRWEGHMLLVLIEGEGVTDDDQPVLIGRSFRDAPEIDGHIIVRGRAPMGSRVMVQITHADVYDLWGTVADG